MKVRDTQVEGEFGAQNPYIEGELKIQYYLDGEDITSNVEQDGDYPTTLYCFYYKTENDGKLNIKYYYKVSGQKFEGSQTYNLVLPGTKLQINGITPGASSEWTYQLKDREVSGNFYYKDPNPTNTVKVYLITDPDSSLKITVSTSDGSKGNVIIRPDKESYNTNDEVEIEATPATGYDFDYWKVTEIRSIGAEIPKNNVTKNPYKFHVTASEKYEAYFKKKVIQIYCYKPSSGDSWTSCDGFTVEYGKDLPNRLIPDKTGYKFIGYFSEKEGKGKQYYKSDYVEDENGDIVERAIGLGVCDFETSPASLYAYYELETYDITYHLNGGSGEMTPTTYTVETATFNLPTPTKQNYFFAGWYGNNQFTGSRISQITKGTTGNQKYWAKWSENDGKIATNKYIKDNILNVYSGYTGSEENKCPTKSQIISRGGNAISIENSGDYADNQCVKVSDITYGGRNANVKVYLKGGIISRRSMETFEVYNGDNKIANISGDSYDIHTWYTLFSDTKFTANNGSNNIFVRIGKFDVASEIYSYFGTSDPSVTNEWITNNAQKLGQLGYNETTKFDCKENWDTWIKGSNTMYIIIVLYE